MSGITIRLPTASISVLTMDGDNNIEVEEQAWSALGILHPGERIDIIVDWSRTSSNRVRYDHMEILLDRE